MVAEQKSLEILELRGDFIRRHIGSNAEQIQEICEFMEKIESHEKRWKFMKKDGKHQISRVASTGTSK